jgi:cell shape-determining protein MreD
MIAALAVAVVGVLFLALQGALATFLPRACVPDFAPLFAIALALQLGGARGLVGAAVIGIAADTLAGAPFGHLTLLCVVPYLGARAANASLELRSRAAQAALAAIWTPLSVLLTLGLAWGAGAHAELAPRFLLGIVLQTGVAAALAPMIGTLVERVVALVFVDESGRRGAPLSVQRRAG